MVCKKISTSGFECNEFLVIFTNSARAISFYLMAEFKILHQEYSNKKGLTGDGASKMMMEVIYNLDKSFSLAYRAVNVSKNNGEMGHAVDIVKP